MYSIVHTVSGSVIWWRPRIWRWSTSSLACPVKYVWGRLTPSITQSIVKVTRCLSRRWRPGHGRCLCCWYREVAFFLLIYHDFVVQAIAICYTLTHKQTDADSNMSIMWVLIIDCLVRRTSWAYHRCILTVTTVMDTPSVVSTVNYRTFISRACNVVQPNLSTSGAELGRPWGAYRSRKSKLATNNLRVIYIPGVITNSSPNVIMIDFNSSFPASRSSHQSQTWSPKKSKKGEWNVLSLFSLVDTVYNLSVTGFQCFR